MSNAKAIYDITPFTQLDYPDKLAAIVWFIGCNMRCLYCYNSNIVFAKEGRYDIDDLRSFLERRVGLLDGVVLSGGEPTLHPLEIYCQTIKQLGFSIKLDTNGLHPKRLRQLLESGLLDYVALDFKGLAEKFGYISGTGRYDYFLESLTMLIESSIDFEVRTTVHPDLLSSEDLNRMIDFLAQIGYKNSYYLQPFLKTLTNMTQLDTPTLSMPLEGLHKKIPIVWR